MSAHASALIVVKRLAEAGHVQVKPEDLRLGELPLQPVGEEHLLELASPGPVLAQEHVPGRLHRDRARALGARALHEVHDRGAQDALVVEAVVLEEPVVLGGDEGLLDDVRDVVGRHRDPTLLADLRDQLAAARVDAQRHLQLRAAHRLDRRQRGLQVNISG